MTDLFREWGYDTVIGSMIFAQLPFRSSSLKPLPYPTVCQEMDMSEVAYESRVEIRRLGGPTRSATLPAESEPVLFGVHGAIAEHYGVDMTKIEPHATTIDYVVAAAGG